MPGYYFSYFPQINYGEANNRCLNLTKNIEISNNVKGQAIFYYPYVIKEGMRSDLLAYSYYGDSYLEWLIFKTNGIVDPYYGWYLNQDDFNNFIVTKYGSIANSQQRVKYFQVDWSDDTSTLSPLQFYSQIPEAFQKYYAPIFGHGSQILYFQRSRDDWIVNTNQIVRLDIKMNNNNQFSNSELVIFNQGGQTIGNAEVIIANSTVLKIQHVFGNVSSNAATIVGLTSNAQANLIDSFVVDYVIPLAEYIYWTPVYLYDYERAKNEANKNIYLIDSRYAAPLATQLRLDMQAAANTPQ